METPYRLAAKKLDRLSLVLQGEQKQTVLAVRRTLRQQSEEMRRLKLTVHALKSGAPQQNLIPGAYHRPKKVAKAPTRPLQYALGMRADNGRAVSL